MHFITVIGYDSKGYIYANDPNKSSAPRKQLQDKFQSCMKQAFIFWPAVNDNKPDDEDKPAKPDEPIVEETLYSDPVPACGTTDVAPEPEEDAPAGATGTEIVDISKWQGTINFDKLGANVAMVIARASCGSDKDIRIDENAKAMNARDIPFGVYCYSYAGDVAKARDEAKKMVDYVDKYHPLFYVMDAEESKITTDAIRAFAETLREYATEKIGCYVAHNHYKDYKFETVRGLWDFVWIPRYGKNNGTLNGSTKPAYKCDLWQYTSTGKIDGINGNVDKNVITGDGESLEWFLARG